MRAQPAVRANTPAVAHILIVDDENNIRRVLAAMLKREGYEVTTAADGEQALAVLQKIAGAAWWSPTSSCPGSAAWSC